MSGPWEKYASAPAQEDAGPWAKYQAAEPAPEASAQTLAVRKAEEERGKGSLAKNVAAGLVRGAGSIGATLLYPVDKITDMVRGDREQTLSTLITGEKPLSRNEERRRDMTAALGSMGADTDSTAFQAGKIGGEIAGTAGAGGAIANTLGRLPGVAAAAQNLLNAVRTSGMSAGVAAPGVGGTLANLGTRAAGGAITGGASAGLVDPNDAKAGAAIGAALPGVLQVAGKAGQAVGAGLKKAVGAASPEVAALAARAKQLGIDIPADRLVDSKPLNALAAGLNYVPFSGRAATEAKMEKQLTKAASKLIGQDSDNMMGALRKAADDLGGKFDATLRNNAVNFDKQLLDESAEVLNVAERELGSDAFKPIKSQVDELIAKGGTGVIDGQAAYNIKRTLDRIGRGKGPEAFHALELKRVLMGALDRSLGPEKAAAFAQTREQYGNMLALEKIAKNGVEGDISVARLANIPNINNQPLQEIADIAAQFVKSREGQHGAAQRAGAGVIAATIGGLPGLAAGAATGRAGNMALNSNTLRNLALGTPNQFPTPPLLSSSLGALYRAAPVIGADQ